MSPETGRSGGETTTEPVDGGTIARRGALAVVAAAASVAILTRR